MKPLKSFKIGNKKISSDGPTYIIAEIGVNHGGSIINCKKLIRAAYKSGADAVKLQIVDPENSYDKNHPSYKVFKNKNFNFQQLKDLIKFSQKLGITLFATPGDFYSLKKIIKLKMPAIKISSGLLTNLPLIKEATYKKIPIILSTGMAFKNEIVDALNVCKKKTNKICILKCTSIYPAPIDKINLRAIQSFRKKFNLPIGYSDHTLGINACISAIVAGATVIEKHFTLNRNTKGADHHISIEPKEFKRMVDKIRSTEKMLGKDTISPTKEEIKMRHKFHRKIVSLKKIKKGDKLSLENLCLKRTNSSLKGLPPKKLFDLIGKISLRNIKSDKIISNKDLANI